MRDDIAAIESRNNGLETQSRSLERLQRALAELLDQLSARTRPLPRFRLPCCYLASCHGATACAQQVLNRLDGVQLALGEHRGTLRLMPRLWHLPASARHPSEAACVQSTLQRRFADPASSAMQPATSVQALETLQLSERTIYPAVAGLSALKAHLDFLAPEEPGRAGLKKEVLRMRVVSDFRGWLLAVLQDFLARCKAALGATFERADLLTRDAPPVRAIK
jgi:hypothetical protein